MYDLLACVFKKKEEGKRKKRMEKKKKEKKKKEKNPMNPKKGRVFASSHMCCVFMYPPCFPPCLSYKFLWFVFRYLSFLFFFSFFFLHTVIFKMTCCPLLLKGFRLK
eukprot:TRINITY_DN4279_c0_g2_i1.p1 TRINITY_DN4279_c0_g2~~TRINITY_DN4279_c0_g2_i1.p1  ORF type:complete len:107 (+),score=0.35 TRINITY_DN4279_c0_g2_i1:338-658(+)